MQRTLSTLLMTATISKPKLILIRNNLSVVRSYSFRFSANSFSCFGCHARSRRSRLKDLCTLRPGLLTFRQTGVGMFTFCAGSLCFVTPTKRPSDGPLFFFYRKPPFSARKEGGNKQCIVGRLEGVYPFY